MLTPSVSRSLEGTLSHLFSHLLFTLVSLSFHPNEAIYYIHYIFLMHYRKVNFPPSIVLSPVPGELLGIDYLYSQTGQALQDVHPDSEETQALLEDVGPEEELDDEGFEESGLDPTVEQLDLSDPAPVTTSSAHTPTPTSLQPSPGSAVSILTAPEQQLVIIIEL